MFTFSPPSPSSLPSSCILFLLLLIVSESTVETVLLAAVVWFRPPGWGIQNPFGVNLAVESKGFFMSHFDVFVFNVLLRSGFDSDGGDGTRPRFSLDIVSESTSFLRPLKQRIKSEMEHYALSSRANQRFCGCCIPFSKPSQCAGNGE